jgi:hypothetical protein
MNWGTWREKYKMWHVVRAEEMPTHKLVKHFVMLEGAKEMRELAVPPGVRVNCLDIVFDDTLVPIIQHIFVQRACSLLFLNRDSGISSVSPMDQNIPQSKERSARKRRIMARYLDAEDWVIWR